MCILHSKFTILHWSAATSPSPQPKSYFRVFSIFRGQKMNPQPKQDSYNSLDSRFQSLLHFLQSEPTIVIGILLFELLRQCRHVAAFRVTDKFFERHKTILVRITPFKKLG